MLGCVQPSMEKYSWRAIGLLILGLGAALGTSRPRAQAPSAAESWAQWRGPLATGEAPRADPPVVWSESLNIDWKIPIPGRGASTPIIWGETIYLQTAVPTGDLKPTAQKFTIDFQRTGESVYYGQSYVQ